MQMSSTDHAKQLNSDLSATPIKTVIDQILIHLNVLIRF